MIQPAFEILNQRGTPMFFSDVFANRPTAGIIGRIFISTDTKEFYRDTGTTWELLAGPGSGTVTGSGVAGQVTFWNGTSSVSGSNNLWWDNATNKFLVGTNNTAGAGALQVTSSTGDDQLRVWGANSPSIRIDNAVTGATQRFVMGLATATNNFIQGSAAGNICISTASASPLLFGMWQTINASEVMRISTSNNLLVGSSTDNGIRFQVTGNGYFSDSIGIATTSLTGYVLRINKNITGSANSFGIGLSSTILSDVNIGYGYFSGLSTANSFTLTGLRHFQANGVTVGSGSTVTTQVGFFVDPSFTTGLSNIAFQGAISSGTNRWNLYMDGTANNYMAGRLAIGSTAVIGSRLVTNRLNLTGATTAIAYEYEGSVQSDVTLEARGFSSYIGTTGTFTLSRLKHFQASATSTFSATISQQFGYFVDAGMIGATNNFGFWGDIPSGTGRWNIYMNGTADNYMAGSLGIGSLSLTGYNLRISKSFTGSSSFVGIFSEGAIQSAVTSSARYFSSYASLQNTAFTLADLQHFFATGDATFGSATVTNQNGFVVSANLTGATNNYGFRGLISSGTGRWNLFMDGAGANHMAGNLLLGSTTNPGQLLYVNGTIRIDGQRSATAGGSSGQHLIINLDGTTYKIALLNN